MLRELENLDEEVRELLENYKHKKATIYEPCTHKNIKECLIGLSEELHLLNISYIFNPHIDIENNTLNSGSVVNLINSVWTLLHYYKDVSESSQHYKEQNYILEQTNKQLNATVNKLKEKLNTEKNEARACVASAQRVSDQSNDLYQKLVEARSKLNQVVKQKETNEKSLQHQITKLKLENQKLTDKLRSRSGTYTPCAEICDSTLRQLKEREKKQKAVISQLQANNQELLHEVLALKEELILAGISDVRIK